MLVNCRYNLHFFFKVHIFVKNDTSAMPEVRGTADVGWRSLFPLPINPPRVQVFMGETSSIPSHVIDSLTTISSHVSTDRRAVTDMNGQTRKLRCAPF